MDFELTINQIQERQRAFCSSIKLYFIRKIKTYKEFLVNNGIQVTDIAYGGTELTQSKSFEDHLELVIRQRTTLSTVIRKNLRKMSGQLSTLRVFRWVYELVQRTKAERILHHFDGVSEADVCAVLNHVTAQLAVAFEFQLAMLAGPEEVSMLGRHAASCMLTYLNSPDSHFAQEELLQAVLEVGTPVALLFRVGVYTVIVYKHKHKRF